MKSNKFTSPGQQWLPTIIAACISAFGFLLILMAESPYVNSFWKAALEHVATAFLIAAILALTVDWWLKRQIAKDVFEASIGRLVPEDLQAEMRWIYEQKAICTNHLQRVKISKLDAATVSYRCQTDRVIENITDHEIEFHIGLGIDDWFQNKPAEISSIGYQIGSEKRVQIDRLRFKRDIVSGRPILRLEPNEKCKLGYKQKIAIWTDSTEVKPINSDHIMQFGYATKNPRVVVEADDGIGFSVTFARETSETKDELGEGSYQFNGLIMPHQDIRVRWWEKDKLKDWLSSNEGTR